MHVNRVAQHTAADTSAKYTRTTRVEPLPDANLTSSTRPKREAASAALVSKAEISSASADQLAALNCNATQGAVCIEGAPLVVAMLCVVLPLRAVNYAARWQAVLKCGCRVDWHQNFEPGRCGLHTGVASTQCRVAATTSTRVTRFGPALEASVVKTLARLDEAAFFLGVRLC